MREVNDDIERLAFFNPFHPAFDLRNRIELFQNLFHGQTALMQRGDHRQQVIQIEHRNQIGLDRVFMAIMN